MAYSLKLWFKELLIAANFDLILKAKHGKKKGA